MDRQFTPLPDRDLTLLQFVAKISGRGALQTGPPGQAGPSYRVAKDS